ncbi:MAG: hypothetical protein ACLTS1_07890 [Coprococcus sp.]
MKAKGESMRFRMSGFEQYLRDDCGNTREEMEALFAFLREYMM